MPTTIYIVTNGNYISGYYLKKENAEKEVAEINALIEEYKNTPNIDRTPCWVQAIETED